MALSPYAFPGFGFGLVDRDPFDIVTRAIDRSLINAFDRGALDALPRGRGGAGGAGSDLSLAPWSSLAGTHPMDITEKEQHFEVHADAPGFTPEDIKVELQEGVLTISGSRQESKEEKDSKGQVWRRERTERRFNRAFTLPATAAHENISANLENGVLTVTVPKLPEAPKPEPKRIAISAGVAKGSAQPAAIKAAPGAGAPVS